MSLWDDMEEVDLSRPWTILTCNEKDLPRGPNGKKICRCGCALEAKKPFRVFHSKLCRSRYIILKDWNVLRYYISHIREKFICQRCGVNVEEFVRDFVKLSWEFGRKSQKYGDLCKCLIYEGWDVYNGIDWWAIHHIIQRKDGGTDYPENLQFLCVPCHKEVHKKR